MKENIPLAKPWLTNKERRYSVSAIKSGWLTQNGSDVKKMESNLLTFLNPNNFENLDLTTTSNGTTALHLALLSLNIEAGDEIIVPDFSYIAVINSVLYCNATPVVVDVNYESWNLDIDAIIMAITKKTKAIIIVDNYGVNFNYEKLATLTPKRVRIIRDASESFPGPTLNFKNYKFISLTTFSFYANKIFTSGEGGAVLGDSKLIKRIKSLKNQSLHQASTFSHKEVGYNYRITNIHAALFNAQWDRRIQILTERNRVFSKYHEQLIANNLNLDSNFQHNPWLFTLRVPQNLADVKILRSKFVLDGVETRPGFTPFSNQKFLKKWIKQSDVNANSVKLSREIISLPTFPQLKNQDIRRIVELLNSYLQHPK